jgi:hypothetical protein
MSELDDQNVEKYKGLAEKLSSIQETPASSILESTFNIAPGSTPKFADKVESHNPVANTVTDPQTGEIIVREIDATSVAIAKEERIEDLQIDGKLNEIYDNAITAFNNHAGLAENADPRFSARNGEVAAQYLKIALDSTNSKVEAKYKRAKVRIAGIGAGSPNSVQNNLVVADRNDILKQLFAKDFEKTIKQEFSED